MNGGFSDPHGLVRGLGVCLSSLHRVLLKFQVVDQRLSCRFHVEAWLVQPGMRSDLVDVWSRLRIL